MDKNIIKNIIAKMDKNSMRECVIRNLDSDYFYDNYSKDIFGDANYHLNKKAWQVYCKMWHGIKNAFPGTDEVLAYDEVAVGKVAKVLKGIVAAHALRVENEIKVFFRGEVIDSFAPKGMSWEERVERIDKSIDKCDVFFFSDGCANLCGYSESKVIVH